MIARRLAASVALLVGGAGLVLAVVFAVEAFPRGIAVAAAVLAAAAAAWYGVLHRSPQRQLGVGVAVLLLAGSIALLVLQRGLLDNLLVWVCLVVAYVAGRRAFAVHVSLPEAARPAHPVLFYNPLSGGGKAERFHLADEASARGIEPIELRRGDDLETLVRTAVAGGADALAMAGGDGSQAIVAAIASELGLSYSCIPAGTRNHFALDLGVDRDDVVGALDALVDGRQRIVDLGEVNGRVFVNNVSLGLYGEAVQREGYREAKVQTLLDTVPEVTASDSETQLFSWTEDGSERRSRGPVILVSNNPYRLARVVGGGTRPRLDTGEVGVAVFDLASRGRHRFREWAAPEFVVNADGPVAIGMDGESLRMDPPLRFRVRPQALRVLIAPDHPGASPSAVLPQKPYEVPTALARIAFGSSPLGDEAQRPRAENPSPLAGATNRHS